MVKLLLLPVTENVAFILTQQQRDSKHRFWNELSYIQVATLLAPLNSVLVREVSTHLPPDVCECTCVLLLPLHECPEVR